MQVVMVTLKEENAVKLDILQEHQALPAGYHRH